MMNAVTNERMSKLAPWLEAGFALLPIVPGAKRPLVAGGYTAASKDEATVAGWLKRWPNANWAVACEASGVFVVDCDEVSEVSEAGGLYQFMSLAQQFAKLPDGYYLQLTPSWGYHFFFSNDYAERPLPSTVKRLGSRIDTRGVGGYVLIPPSVVDGSEYTPMDGDWPARIRNLPPAPQWLADALVRPMQDHESAIRRAFAKGRDDETRLHSMVRIVEWLSRVKEGERNNALYWAACELRDIGISRDEAERALINACAINRLPEKEAARTIASAYK